MLYPPTGKRRLAHRLVVLAALFALLASALGPRHALAQTIAPADPQASADVRAILAYLAQLRANGQVLSGQELADYGEQNGDYYMRFVEALRSQTGKYVGLVGVDYKQNDVAGANAVLKYWWEKGGLVTVASHFSDPWTGGRAWVTDQSAPKHDLAELLDRTTPAGARWHAELDAIAAGLDELQQHGVTVIYRPLHEMNGAWFWWGVDMTNRTRTIEPYKNLYRYLFDYFTEEKGLHNLIWVFDIATSWDQRGLLFYPGDAYVDIAATNRYTDDLGEWYDPSYGSYTTDYADMRGIGKLTAFGEVGPDRRDGAWDTRTILSRIRDSQTEMSYFLSWHSWNDDQGYRKVALVDNQYASELLNDPAVITLDELSWRSSPPPSTVYSRISPILECVVQHNSSSYTAYFGYNNTNDVSVFVPAGQTNRFSPTPIYRNQSLIFAPGRSPYHPNAAFSIAFNGSNLVWNLRGRTATASSSSARCASTLPANNLVQNPSFESGTMQSWENWGNMAVDGADRYNGSYGAHIGPMGGGAQQVAVSPSSSYTLGVWGKTTGTQWGAVQYRLYNSAGQPLTGETALPPFTNSYSYRSAIIQTTADTASIRISVWNNAGGELFLDEVGLDGTPPPATVVNPGFETGNLTGWQPWAGMTASAASPHIGSWSARIDGGTAGGGGQQTIVVQAGQSYSLSAWGYVTGGQWSAVGYRFFDNLGAQIGATTYLPAFGASYAQRGASFVAPMGSARMQIIVWTDGGGLVYLDDIGLSNP